MDDVVVAIPSAGVEHSATECYKERNGVGQWDELTFLIMLPALSQLHYFDDDGGRKGRVSSCGSDSRL